MTQGKRKALFFVPSGTGGAERMTVNIAKCLPLDIYDVKFIILSKEIGTISSFIPSNYNVKHVSIRNIYDFVTFRIIHIIKQEKADVVFSSMHYINVRLILASKLCGNRVIIRSNTGLYRTPSPTLELVKLTYQYADMIIAQQDEMRDEIVRAAKVSSDRIITMPNMLDVDTIRLKALDPSPYTNIDEIRFIIVGRADDPVKGHDVAIKAFSTVKKKIEKAHLYVVGKFDPNLTFCQYLTKLVDELGIKDSVHFIGYDSNPYKWIKNANCYVLSSRQEGMPNVLLEALSLKIPCVATCCVPVIERIVINGKNGYVVPSENPDAMSMGMIRALELHDIQNVFKTSTKQEFTDIFNQICAQ